MKVICLMAQSIDGNIAIDSNHIPNWTESADKKFFREETLKSNIIVLGNNTFKTFSKPLPKRIHIVQSRKTKNWKTQAENVIYTNLSPEKIHKKIQTEYSPQQIFIIGGTQINTLWAKTDLIDELWITVSPIIFGQGLKIFDKTITPKLILFEHQKIGDNTILLKYKISRKN